VLGWPKTGRLGDVLGQQVWLEAIQREVGQQKAPEGLVAAWQLVVLPEGHKTQGPPVLGQQVGGAVVVTMALVGQQAPLTS